MKAWYKYTKKFQIGTTLESVLYTPIWLNTSSKLFYPNWFKASIHNVIDLLDNNGNFTSFEDLKRCYGISGTFLDFIRTLKTLPKLWKEFISAKKDEVIQYNVMQAKIVILVVYVKVNEVVKISVNKCSEFSVY